MSKQTPPRMGWIDIKETGENGMKIRFSRRILWAGEVLCEGKARPKIPLTRY